MSAGISQKRRFTIAFLGLCLFAGLVGAVRAASAEIPDIDDDLRAAVQKEKVKQHKNKNDMRGRNGGGSNKGGDCGHVDIGNSDDSRGSSRIAQREKTVIVTGPVINATNCK